MAGRAAPTPGLNATRRGQTSRRRGETRGKPGDRTKRRYVPFFSLVSPLTVPVFVCPSLPIYLARVTSMVMERCFTLYRVCPGSPARRWRVQVDARRCELVRLVVLKIRRTRQLSRADQLLPIQHTVQWELVGCPAFGERGR